MSCGLRKGYILSPLLFNPYLDDIVKYLKSSNIGVSIDEEKVCIMLYVDDIVLLATNETYLQVLLNALTDWCDSNNMFVNCSKSNVVLFDIQVLIVCVSVLCAVKRSLMSFKKVHISRNCCQ